MNVKRFLLVAAVSLFCAGVVRADIPISSDFYIGLEGWQSGQQFDATGYSTILGTNGFTENSFTPSYCWYCFCDEDPETKVNGGNDAMPFDSGTNQFTLTSPTETFDYVNDAGFDLQSLVLTVQLTEGQLDEQFTCSSTVFSFCGFKIIAEDPKLEILFTNVPEPRPYLPLLIALCAGVAVDQFRRRRARA